MGKQNKVITTFQQDFTESEKARARRNISAMSLSQRFYISGNKAITASESSEGFFSISFDVPSSRRGRIWFEDFSLNYNSSQQDDVIPMSIRYNYTYEDDTQNGRLGPTGIIAKMRNAFRFSLSTTSQMSNVKTVEYTFEFPEGKIAEGTVLHYEIGYNVID